MTSKPDAVEQHEVVADSAILQATDLALKALQEITDVETIGAHVGAQSHDQATATLFFDCLLPGYPGWRWAASLAKVSPEDPVTVLEVELVPGDEALVAPEWVPWAERLAAFREAQAQQAEEEEAEAARAAAEWDDDDDVMDNDYGEYDVDLDGVDVDALDDDDVADDDDDFSGTEVDASEEE